MSMTTKERFKLKANYDTPTQAAKHWELETLINQFLFEERYETDLIRQVQYLKAKRIVKLTAELEKEGVIIGGNVLPSEITDLAPQE